MVVATVAISALGTTGFAVAAALIGAGIVFWAARREPDMKPQWMALGVLWVALPCISLLWLARQEAGGRATLLWLLGVVWATDIGAYAVGRSLGGPRLAPRWSPRKTWTGFVGGTVCAALAGGVTAVTLGVASTAPLILVSAGLAIVAQFGDLAESLAKRRFGVKDFERPDPWAWRTARSRGRLAGGDTGSGALNPDRRPQRCDVAMNFFAGVSPLAMPPAGATARRRHERE